MSFGSDLMLLILGSASYSVAKSFLGLASCLATATISRRNLASCLVSVIHHPISKTQCQAVHPSQIRGSIPTSHISFASTIGPFLSLDSLFDLLAVVGNLFGNLKEVPGSGEAELVQA